MPAGGKCDNLCTQWAAIEHLPCANRCHGHSVPNPAFITLYTSPRLLVTTVLRGVCYYSHFPHEEMKLWKDK